ncbi:NUDIX hydrolase [Planctellipticum variicoloris]|uniref:NUDIX hydrolase n=1 Tax=Planctellipticum variicoloris TaxID=3064265 RepID=UPI0030138453|nr:NUDIX hydrolase [Planctomycetaceae bacterium SH412]
MQKRTKREVLGKGKFLRLVKEGRWEFAERINARGAVAIFAVTDDRRLVLTEQFRPAVGKSVIDVPAGLSGDVKGQETEDFVISAQRELSEETGYEATTWEWLGDSPSSPGLASEVVSYFFAAGATQTSAGGGVEHEQIQVHAPPLRTISRWLQRQVAEGKLIDPKVYVALYFATKRRRG